MNDQRRTTSGASLRLLAAAIALACGIAALVVAILLVRSVIG